MNALGNQSSTEVQQIVQAFPSSLDYSTLTYNEGKDMAAFGELLLTIQAHARF